MLGWEAVGRLDLPNGAFCTGVMIADELVLTAAHCLFDPESRQQITAKGALFRAGYLNGRSISERRIVDFAIAEGFEYIGPVMPAAEAARDVALLQLDSPIFAAEAEPFKIFDSAGFVDQVQAMSYGRDRAEAMSWQAECSVLRESRALWEFDCAATFGSSGAPVFVRDNGRMRILSLVSGTWITNEGDTRAIGMKLMATVDTLREMLVPAPQSQTTKGVKRLLVGQQKSEIGAKFLTP